MDIIYHLQMLPDLFQLYDSQEKAKLWKPQKDQ